MIVVANKYRLVRIDGKFTKDGKILVKENVKLTQDWVDRISDNWITSGQVYVVDEAKTKDWHEESKIAREIAKENEVNFALIQNQAVKELASKNEQLIRQAAKPIEVIKTPEAKGPIQIDLDIKGKEAKDAN